MTGMTRLHCARYPQLQAITPSGKVIFRDGEAEATAEQVKSLLGLPASYGITVVNEPPPKAKAKPEVVPEPPAKLGPPAKSAPKSDWIAYAVDQGADKTDAASATKDELIQIYGGS